MDIADIQDYFEFITKKHETLTEILLYKFIPIKLKNRIQIKIIIFRNNETIREYKNLVNNNYQQASKVLFTFVLNKQFGQLINIAPHSLTMLSTTNTEFSFTEVWFTDQNSESLEIEDNVNLTLIIGLAL